MLPAAAHTLHGTIRTDGRFSPSAAIIPRGESFAAIRNPPQDRLKSATVKRRRPLRLSRPEGRSTPPNFFKSTPPSLPASTSKWPTPATSVRPADGPRVQPQADLVRRQQLASPKPKIKFENSNGRTGDSDSPGPEPSVQALNYMDGKGRERNGEKRPAGLREGAVDGLPIVVDYFPVAMAFGCARTATSPATPACSPPRLAAPASSWPSTSSGPASPRSTSSRHLPPQPPPLMMTRPRRAHQEVRRGFLPFIAFGVTDESFSVASLKTATHAPTCSPHGVAYCAWAAGTAAGYLFGNTCRPPSRAASASASTPSSPPSSSCRQKIRRRLPSPC
jgi:hypothetical protein